MGYDMHVINADGSRAYRIDYSDGDDFEKTVLPQIKERDDLHLYFRRSISGGIWQCQRLERAGMGYFGDLQYVECGCTDYTGGFCCDVNRRMLGAVDADRPGINLAKMCSTNDGWHVTRLECLAALALWEAAGRPDVDDGYGDLIPFLRAAAEHDGFVVW